MEAALGGDDFQRGRPEGAQRRSAHAADGPLVLALNPLVAVPSQLRCVEHSTLHDRRLEVARCCWWKTVLVDDATKSGLGLTGLRNSPAAVLCECPACGLRGEADGLVPDPDSAATAAMARFPGGEDRRGVLSSCSLDKGGRELNEIVQSEPVLQSPLRVNRLHCRETNLQGGDSGGKSRCVACHG